MQKLPRDLDINSDHNIVVMDMNLRKKNNRGTKRKWCMDKLKIEEIRRDFNKGVNELLQETTSIRNQSIVEEEWKKIKGYNDKYSRKTF